MADFLIELIDEYNSGFSQFTEVEAKEFKKEIMAIARSEKRAVAHLFKKVAPIKKTPPKKTVVKTTPKPKKTAPAPKKEAVKSPTKQVKRESGGKVKPIGKLGTGANIYFQSDKYRVNENSYKPNEYLLNIEEIGNPIPIDNIIFNNVEKAVNIAKKLQKEYPKGVPANFNYEKFISAPAPKKEAVKSPTKQVKREEGGKPTDIKFPTRVRNTLITENDLSKISKADKEKVIALIKEFKSIHYVDAFTELGPDQLRRMSERQLEKISQNALKVFRIEEQLQYLILPEEKKKILAKQNQQDKLKKELEFLKVRKQTIENYLGHKLESTRRNPTKREYNEILNKIKDLENLVNPPKVEKIKTDKQIDEEFIKNTLEIARPPFADKQDVQSARKILREIYKLNWRDGKPINSFYKNLDELIESANGYGNDKDIQSSRKIVEEKGYDWRTGYKLKNTPPKEAKEKQRSSKKVVNVDILLFPDWLSNYDKTSKMKKLPKEWQLLHYIWQSLNRLMKDNKIYPNVCTGTRNLCSTIQEELSLSYDKKRITNISKGEPLFKDIKKNLLKVIDDVENKIPTDNFKDILNNLSYPAPKKEAVKSPTKQVKKAKMLKGDDTILETPAEEIPGYYAIMELDDIIQSHDPVTFDWNKKYPKQCQERDYRKSAEKDKVLTFASNFKPQNLVNDSPEAMSGPSVINPDGIVLGGNGRIMILKRVHKNGQFFVYENYLGKRASFYGFNETEIKTKFDNPTLVRVVNAPLSRCMFYSRLLNESLSREKDETTNSLSLSKSLSNQSFLRIADIFDNEDNETFRATIDKNKNQLIIIEILRKDGIITSSNSPKWIDNKGKLTDNAKNQLEKLLLAKILPSEELISTAKEYTNRIMKAIPVLIKIEQLPKEYNLIPILQDVIKFEARRREQGLTIKQFLNQESMFGSDDKPETITAMLWLALSSGVNKFRQILDSYYNSAKNNISEDSMFGLPKASPTEILTKIVDVKGLSDRFDISENSIDSGFIKKGNAVYGFYGKDCKYYYIAGSKFNNGAKSFIQTAMNDFSAYNKKNSSMQGKIYRFTNKKQAESRLNSLLLASGYYENKGENTQLTLANRPRRKVSYGRKNSGLSSNPINEIKRIIKSDDSFVNKLKKIVRY